MYPSMNQTFKNKQTNKKALPTTRLLGCFWFCAVIKNHQEVSISRNYLGPLLIHVFLDSSHLTSTPYAS